MEEVMVESNLHGEEVLSAMHLNAAVIKLIPRHFPRKATLREGTQIISIIIDGWSWERDYRSNRAELFRGCVDHKLTSTEADTRKKWKGLRKGKEIGIIDEDGKLVWFSWIYLAQYLGFDFARMLSKGSSFRIKNSAISLKSLNDVSRELYTNIARDKGISLWSAVNYSANRITGDKVLKSRLREAGWVIRKEDRGNRSIICSVKWEERQILQLVKQGKVSETKKAPNARMYWQPKAHKEEIDVPGRPIVSWGEGTQPYHKVINRSLKNWLKSRPMSFVEWSTDECFAKIKPTRGVQFIGGDIKNLFTEIPRNELLEFIDDVFEAELGVLVRKHLEATTFLFHGKVYEWLNGVDMGSRVSPMLSIAFVQYKLEITDCFNILADSGIAEGCVQYVDDLGFKLRGVDALDVDEKIEMVQTCVGMSLEPLVVEWDDRKNKGYMDVGFDEPVWGNRSIRDVTKKSLVYFYNDRGRRFGLEREFEVPRGVFKSSRRVQCLRILDRDGHAGRFAHARHDTEVYGGEGFEDPVSKYFGLQHYGAYEQCKVCTLIEESVQWRNNKKEKKGQYFTVSLLWNALLNTKVGGRHLKALIDKLKVQCGGTLQVRWRVENKRLAHVIYSRESLKDFRSSLTTDDDPVVGVETG
jgi:hypothetical protein